MGFSDIYRTWYDMIFVPVWKCWNTPQFDAQLVNHHLHWSCHSDGPKSRKSEGILDWFTDIEVWERQEWILCDADVSAFFLLALSSWLDFWPHTFWRPFHGLFWCPNIFAGSPLLAIEPLLFDAFYKVLREWSFRVFQGNLMKSMASELSTRCTWMIRLQNETSGPRPRRAKMDESSSTCWIFI